MLDGRPGPDVKVLSEPTRLYLPLRTRRFAFNELCVKEAQRVNAGYALAKDTDNFSVPLLSPRAGTVRLNRPADHIVLKDLAGAEQDAYSPSEEPPHIAGQMGSAGIKRHKLLTLGAWQFFLDAHTGALPDPYGTPQAVIVSAVSCEPFVARGDVQLRKELPSFTRGLEHLQSLLEYQPIYLVMPDTESELARQIRDKIRGYVYVRPIEIPLVYPNDNFTILARQLGLNSDNGPVWALRSEGVLAVDRALTMGRACTKRVISIGGPAVNSPAHAEVVCGYPLDKILDLFVPGRAGRIINGGVLTGKTIEPGERGLDAECRGLTILPEPQGREFLSFARPGWDRSSYAKYCFGSSLRAKFSEPLTTALRGEQRACVACNFCEEVCPAGIMPHLIHKYLYNDDLDAVERARVDLCVGCGLCSFVCPSKIELATELIDAHQRIRCELQSGEAIL